MADRPQIYLSTPAQFDLPAFLPRLAAVLDAAPVACLRLALAGSDETVLGRAADTIGETCRQRDLAVVIDRHWKLAVRHGLDGVHLPDGARHVREARKALGPDRVVGAFCGTSRHDGMTAAEIGADYVSFGPVGASPLLGDGSRAGADLFAWWAAMIETPVVAEGGLTPALAESLTEGADFVCLGDEIWSADDPAAAIRAYLPG
jgi:thiamine-phosphate pyrophosphorylase